MFARRGPLTVCLACVVCAGLLTLFHPVGAQQPTENPFALVVVHDRKTGANNLLQFNIEGYQIGNKMSLGTASSVLVSGNGQWLALQKSDPQKQQEWLEYREMANSITRLVRVDNSKYAVFAAFSRDSRYLLYGAATGSNRPDAGVIGIIDLASGARAEYTGEIADVPDSKAPFLGIPWPLDFNGRRLWFLTPNSDRVPVTLSFTDLPGFQAGSHTALPGPVEPWHKLRYDLGAAQLSPDGNRLLYLFNNPANPAVGYQPVGLVRRPLNSLAVIDLNTGTDRIIAQAGKGQALETAAWWGAGEGVVFTGGNYQNSARLVSPGLYSVDVNSGQVAQMPSSLFQNTPQESIMQMPVCSTAMFYITRAGDGSTDTLYVAPLADLHRGKTLLSGDAETDFNFIRCVHPGSTT